MSFRSKNLRYIFLVVVTNFLAIGWAEGQTTATKQPAGAAANQPEQTSADPSLTTSVYGDWTLRCVRITTQAGTKTCEVFNSILASGQQSPIAQVAFGKAPTGSEMQVTVLLPNNVTFTPPPAIQMGNADSTPLSLTWQKCLPLGCFASASIDQAALGQWQKSNTPGKLEVVDGGGSTASLPISNRGLNESLDALSKVK